MKRGIVYIERGAGEDPDAYGSPSAIAPGRNR
jgi:hypothetical protein